MYAKQGIAIQILLESLEIVRGCRFLTAGPAENPVSIRIFHFFIAFPFFAIPQLLYPGSSSKKSYYESVSQRGTFQYFKKYCMGINTI